MLSNILLLQKKSIFSMEKLVSFYMNKQEDFLVEQNLDWQHHPLEEQ